MLDEASTSASWERIAELQTLFSSLQTFYADMMANGAARQASVPVNHVKVLSRADAFLSYLSTKRVARIIKIPTIEEGQSFGYPAPWSIADKATIARSKSVSYDLAYPAPHLSDSHVIYLRAIAPCYRVFDRSQTHNIARVGPCADFELRDAQPEYRQLKKALHTGPQSLPSCHLWRPASKSWKPKPGS